MQEELEPFLPVKAEETSQALQAEEESPDLKRKALDEVPNATPGKAARLDLADGGLSLGQKRYFPPFLSSLLHVAQASF